MIKWPDIKFPPVNLYSAPHWPPYYLDLEKEFTKDITEQFNEATNNTMYKEVLRLEVLSKREEFNRLWNQRVGG